jgi:hypothetical protein
MKLIVAVCEQCGAMKAVEATRRGNGIQGVCRAPIPIYPDSGYAPCEGDFVLAGALDLTNEISGNELPVSQTQFHIEES